MDELKLTAFQNLLCRIQQEAVDSEHQPITCEEVPVVANQLLQQWMSNPLFREMLEECLDNLRFG